MNAYEMKEELGLRLEDASEKKFKPPFKLLQLNNAQDMLAHLLVNQRLTELEVLQVHTDSDGVITMDGSGTTVAETQTATAYKVLGGAQGILNVRLDDTNKFATRLEMEDLKKTENYFLIPSTTSPQYYIFENKIYVLPTSGALWSIFYLKVPTQLIYNFTIASIGADTITADGSQDLEETADYYNNAVVYCPAADRYFVITDDDGSLGFTCTPNPNAASADGDKGAVTAADTFSFVTNDFDQTTLSGVTCDLNEALHELVVAFAEASCWKMGNKLDRSKAILDMALLEVKTLNEKYKVESGIGLGGK